MNLFELANIRFSNNFIASRQERIKKEGSPRYSWTMPVTATTASAAIDVQTQFPDSRKYEPLDFLEIVNNEPNNDLTVAINGGDSFYVPASTIRTIRGAFWHIRVTNNGGVNTTLGKIVLTLQREPQTIDKWSRFH